MKTIQPIHSFIIVLIISALSLGNASCNNEEAEQIPATSSPANPPKNTPTTGATKSPSAPPAGAATPPEESNPTPGTPEYAKAKADAIKAIQNDDTSSAFSSVFRDLPKNLRGNREVALEAIKKYGGATLEYMSASLQADKDVVLEAVKKDGTGLNYASELFLEDGEVVLETVKRNGTTLSYVSASLKANRKVVLEAVKNDGFALFFCIKRFASG